ncbi:hypothetical protein MKX08_002033 [Trichoderma sp. CBMAI-0020]|nr:hypothetical protein MKX08_002033 [Trichoderma sp. CBMAI-0020]
MANNLSQGSQSLPKSVLRDKTRVCKQLFRDCFEILGLEYDDWLEQRCSEFNWWASGLSADSWGPGSLDSRLKLRPDIIEVVSKVLDGLESSLSSYYEIGLAAISSPVSEGFPSEFSEAVDQSKDSTDVERSPSPWSDMSDSSGRKDGASETSNFASSDHDKYYESRVYIKTNLEILIRIHTAIKRSGLKFKNQRADEALKQADEAYQRQKAEFGESSAIQGQNGNHERFRRYLTKLVLWNGYTQSLIDTMNFRIAELIKTSDPKDQCSSQTLHQEKKLLVIFRAYFQDPARLTTVQRRLINTNVIRRNRLIHAGNATKPSLQTKEVHQKQPEPKSEVTRPSTFIRPKTVLPSSQPQPPLIAPEEPNKGDEKLVEGFVAQPATAVDSRFTITGALAPHPVTKSAATKVSARVQYLDYPKCPVKHGQFPCPYCSTMLTDEYTKEKKWRPGLVTLEKKDEEGIDAIASPSSISQEAGFIQLEEDEHIATHIHEFALQSLPDWQEATSEGSRVSLSQSSSRSSFQITFQGPEDQETSSSYQPSLHSRNDITHMLEDLHNNLRGLFSDQRLPNIIKLSPKDIAELDYDKFLLNDLSNVLVRDSKIVQRSFGILGGKDIDAIAVSLNDCHVSISQIRDSIMDDTIEEPLRNQLLHNLHQSVEMLQQAFYDTESSDSADDDSEGSIYGTSFHSQKSNIDIRIKYIPDTPVPTGSESTTHKEIHADITNFVHKSNLSSFFSNDSSYLYAIAEKAVKFRNQEESRARKDIYIQSIARLNLYQPVLYCDDSTSMRIGKRLGAQKKMVRRVTQLSTCLAPLGCGTSLQFINLNSKDVHNDKLSYADVKKKINSMHPHGNTKIGTNLNKKILQPLIYDTINSGKELKRPIFISCMTDGCPSGESTEKFQEEILNCVRFLDDNDYPRSTVRFQISQIGNDPRADGFLEELRLAILRDPDLKEVLYCTADRLDEKFYELKDDDEMLEQWLLQTLMTPLMGERIGTLNF